MEIKSKRNLRRPRNKMKSTFILNEYQIQYYKELKEAKDCRKKIASASLGFPGEILWPFGITPMYSQNHAAMYATFDMARDVLEEMEGRGWLSDICSEVKIALGAMLYDLQLPYHLPKPDMVLSATNVCRSMAKFGEKISDSLNIPHFLLDIPFLKTPDSPKAHMEYIIQQIKELMEFLANQTGNNPDPEEISEARRLSEKAVRLWNEILELSAARPSPVDALDFYIHMFPIITLRGRKRAVEYYEILKSELMDWVDRGIGALKNEKFRLLWDYLPVYHKINFFSDLFASKGASIVTSTFFFPLGGVTRAKQNPDGCDKESDFIGLARDFMNLYPNFSIRQKVDTIKNIISKFSIDGVVIHCDRSCKPQSLMQYTLKNMIEKETQIPCLIIDSDSVDPRFFSEEQTITRVEAFLECLPAG